MLFSLVMYFRVSLIVLEQSITALCFAFSNSYIKSQLVVPVFIQPKSPRGLLGL